MSNSRTAVFKAINARQMITVIFNMDFDFLTTQGQKE
jgi:hypothetical protein